MCKFNKYLFYYNINYKCRYSDISDNEYEMREIASNKLIAELRSQLDLVYINILITCYYCNYTFIYT